MLMKQSMNNVEECSKIAKNWKRRVLIVADEIGNGNENSENSIRQNKAEESAPKQSRDEILRNESCCSDLFFFWNFKFVESNEGNFRGVSTRFG
jgi:hypothetical protein